MAASKNSSNRALASLDFQLATINLSYVSIGPVCDFFRHTLQTAFHRYGYPTGAATFRERGRPRHTADALFLW